MTQKQLRFSKPRLVDSTETGFQEWTRFQAMYLLKSKRYNQSEIALKLGVTRAAVSKWKRAVERWGKSAIAKTKRLPHSFMLKFSNHQESLEVRLRAGAKKNGWPDDKWTGQRVLILFWRILGQMQSRTTMMRVMNRIGWQFDHEKRSWVGPV
jgi:transposase-like protein